MLLVMIVSDLFEKSTHLVEFQSSPYFVFEPVELAKSHVHSLIIILMMKRRHFLATAPSVLTGGVAGASRSAIAARLPNAARTDKDVPDGVDRAVEVDEATLE